MANDAFRNSDRTGREIRYQIDYTTNIATALLLRSVVTQVLQ